MKFLLGKEEKGVVTVVELFVDELVKLATATESRRWYEIKMRAIEKRIKKGEE